MKALMKNRFGALVWREYVDNRNGYFWIPVILGGLQLIFAVIAMVGFGSLPFDMITDGQFDNLPALLDYQTEQAALNGVDFRAATDAGIAILYWMTSTNTLVALPFVIFFSLLGSLYEERRDKSILFWKSMPVSDWQEVGAKFVAALIVAPAIAFALMLVLMFLVMIVLTIYGALLGLPVSLLWPIGSIFTVWFTGLSFFIGIMLWLMPFAGWLLLVSAFSPRMPFVFAVLPPVVVGVSEVLFFHTTNFFEWLGSRFTGLFLKIANQFEGFVEPEEPQEVVNLIQDKIIGGSTVWNAIGQSLADPQIYIGFAITGLFLWGAVELRKRANA